MLTALYAASPPGTGIQFHLYASPAIRAPLARYANLRLAADVPYVLDQELFKARPLGCRFSSFHLATPASSSVPLSAGSSKVRLGPCDICTQLNADREAVLRG